jgi:hypothetical protein
MLLKNTLIKFSEILIRKDDLVSVAWKNFWCVLVYHFSFLHSTILEGCKLGLSLSQLPVDAGRNLVVESVPIMGEGRSTHTSALVVSPRERVPRCRESLKTPGLCSSLFTSIHPMWVACII